jgi:hypothetical protein
MDMNERGDRSGKRLDGSPPANVSKQIHAHIGGQLRQMFDEVVQEPIPDKLRRLLEDLEQSAPSRNGAAKNGHGNGDDA